MPVSKERVIRARKGLGVPEFAELWGFRELFWLLVMRDIKLKYKQTAVGVIWVVLQPLITALLFSVLFGYFAKFSGPEDVPYLLFAFVGMLSWLVFSQVVQRASSSLVGDARLISKVYFPRLLIPLASATAVLMDFFVVLCVLLVLMPFYDLSLSWNCLFVFPLLVVEMLFAIGLATFLAAWNVHYRDFIHVTPFVLQLWMYASPLFYPFTLIPEGWQSWFALNPLVGFTEGLRWALLGGADFPFSHVMVALAISICMFFFGMVAFEKLERTFADVI